MDLGLRQLKLGGGSSASYPHQLRVHTKLLLMIFYAYADCAARDFPFHVFNINPHNYICNYVGGGLA